MARAFRGNIGRLKNHWVRYGRREKRNPFCASKAKNILLDKVYYFSLTMQFNIYNKWRRDHQPRGHQNQWIRTNQLQYPLKRFGDVVGWRNNWFMRDKNQRIGPEHSFIGNNKVLWTTATKEKRLDRATTIGVAMTTGVFK